MANSLKINEITIPIYTFTLFQRKNMWKSVFWVVKGALLLSNSCPFT